MFQFHIVRLKDASDYKENFFGVSIPYSSIKSLLDSDTGEVVSEFQFHIVRLKGRMSCRFLP